MGGILCHAAHRDIAEEEPKRDGKVKEEGNKPLVTMQDQATDPPSTNKFSQGRESYAVTRSQMIACPRGRYPRQ